MADNVSKLLKYQVMLDTRCISIENWNIKPPALKLISAKKIFIVTFLPRVHLTLQSHVGTRIWSDFGAFLCLTFVLFLV